jgi:hypothetical protein
MRSKQRQLKQLKLHVKVMDAKQKKEEGEEEEEEQEEGQEEKD